MGNLGTVAINHQNRQGVSVSCAHSDHDTLAHEWQGHGACILVALRGPLLTPPAPNPGETTTPRNASRLKWATQQPAEVTHLTVHTRSAHQQFQPWP